MALLALGGRASLLALDERGAFAAAVERGLGGCVLAVLRGAPGQPLRSTALTHESQARGVTAMRFFYTAGADDDEKCALLYDTMFHSTSLF